jgi:hypothetical protein
MPDQLPHLESLASVWAQAKAAGLTDDELITVVKAAVDGAVRAHLRGRINTMHISTSPDTRERLGVASVGVGDELFAVRKTGAQPGCGLARYDVVRLEASGDVAVADFQLFETCGREDVEAAAREALKLASAGTPSRIEEIASADGSFRFRHNDGEIYEVRTIATIGKNLVCRVSRADGTDIALFEVTVAAGRAAVLELAYGEVTHANLTEALPGVLGPTFMFTAEGQSYVLLGRSSADGEGLSWAVLNGDGGAVTAFRMDRGVHTQDAVIERAREVLSWEMAEARGGAAHA